ncbi:MAG: DUF512 domain-containing protein [Firmicutes bacterium]|nr:DUF512 domain-containing protein [Bacillota bacterium]
MAAIITGIEAESPATGKAKIGDMLVSVNSRPIEDVLDYKFYTYDSRLTLALKGQNGRFKLVRVNKPEGTDLGLTFESRLMDRPRACRNHCLFCFVDQLPRGLRQSLYFKDDDARLSFLSGNYITLTNLSEREMERILALKISPIHVSVHATSPALRAKLMGNPEAAEGFHRLRRLSAGGVETHCQIVCCPGLNDGPALQRTMGDLASLYPQVKSVSVVPVGLTRHREQLPALRAFDANTAAETVRQVEAFAGYCLRKHGSRIFFCADEFYLKAGFPLPEDVAYEDYPQLENGVGMLRLFETEFLAALDEVTALTAVGAADGASEAPRPTAPPKPFSLATGVAAAPIFVKLLETAAKNCGILQYHVYPVANTFFGETVDVAGLVTGGDLIAALRGKDLGERLLIPQTMLRQGEGVFLDDVTVEDVQRELNVPVIPVPVDGAALVETIFDL